LSAREQLLAGPVEDACLAAPTDRRIARPRPAVARPQARARMAVAGRRARGALLVADVAAAGVATAIAGAPGGPSAVVLVVLLAWLHGLYHRDGMRLRRTTLDEAPHALHVAVLTSLVLVLAAGPAVARGPVLVLTPVLLVAMLGARAAARALVARVAAPERCLFVGDAREYERLRGRLAARGVHAELAGRLALRGTGEPAAAAGDVVALRALLGDSGAQRVVIAADALAPAELLEVVHAAEEAGVRASVLPRAADVLAAGRGVAVDDLDGLTVVGVRPFALPWPARAAKRAFDLAVAGAALVAAGPLMVAIAVAILVDSGRPVLFRQARMGRGERPFQILKFRTMHLDADARRPELRRAHGLEEELFKLERDPRVTRVGRVLRATSLDELPQLLNVLRGEMSLVGPRPLVLDEDGCSPGIAGACT
jgi:hypothetical protein